MDKIDFKIQENLLTKMLQHTIELYFKQDIDRMMYGDSYIQFGERELRIIIPTEIKHTQTIAPKGVHGTSILKLNKREIGSKNKNGK